MEKKNCFGIEIRLVSGDITRFEGDAIVNPANTLLIMGGGVAGALKRKGGKEIEEEARKSYPLPIGKAIVTRAGMLKAKMVIHAPTVELPGSRSSFESVKSAVKASLKVAKENGLKRIAFPLMGAGVGGLSPEDSAEAMIEAIAEEKASEDMEIYLYAFDDDDYRKVKGKIEELCG